MYYKGYEREEYIFGRNVDIVNCRWNRTEQLRVCCEKNSLRSMCTDEIGV